MLAPKATWRCRRCWQAAAKEAERLRLEREALRKEYESQQVGEKLLRPAALVCCRACCASKAGDGRALCRSGCTGLWSERPLGFPPPSLLPQAKLDAEVAAREEQERLVIEQQRAAARAAEEQRRRCICHWQHWRICLHRVQQRCLESARSLGSTGVLTSMPCLCPLLQRRGGEKAAGGGGTAAA